MYGLVNKAIEGLVCSAFSEDTWDDIVDEAGLDDATFLSMQPYDDKITYDLVAAASKVLKMPAADVLRAFGRYWSLFTASEGYGPLIDLAGQDTRTVLGNLDELHQRVAANMTELVPPSFEVEDIEGGVRVHYRSKRAGLAPMVVGLLEGLAEKYREVAEVTQIQSIAEGADHDVFDVGLRPA